VRRGSQVSAQKTGRDLGRQAPGFKTALRLRWLGPLDEIPDVAFPAFLVILHNHFNLECKRLTMDRVRVLTRPFNPSDPDARWFPILAMDQGTLVDSEMIKALLDKFGRTEQEFRDAYNFHYQLRAPNPDQLELPDPDNSAS